MLAMNASFLMGATLTLRRGHERRGKPDRLGRGGRNDATANDDLEHEGQADQAKANTRKVGENVKNTFTN